jgi:hypothetical protein
MAQSLSANVVFSTDIPVLDILVDSQSSQAWLSPKTALVDFEVQLGLGMLLA